MRKRLSLPQHSPLISLAAMTQNIGGSGATILTHILVGEE